VRLTVTVPATSANLGPGFDCLGLALDLVNIVTVDTDRPASVTWEGEGAGELPTGGDDLIARSMAAVASAAGRALPPMARHGVNAIPLERGLGSSAAAVVAGVLLADRLLGLEMGPQDQLDAAVGIEGHPDNAAAAILGGLTLAYGEGVLRMEPAADLSPVLLVPERVRLATAEARAALPSEVPMADAVFNAGHAALAVVALTATPRLLADALRDRLHQPYRLPLVPEVREVFERLQDEGVPVAVSGAGPTLLAFDLSERRVSDPGEGWRVLRPGVRSSGATVEPG
jgi:homoserine kinase